MQTDDIQNYGDLMDESSLGINAIIGMFYFYRY